MEGNEVTGYKNVDKSKGWKKSEALTDGMAVTDEWDKLQDGKREMEMREVGDLWCFSFIWWFEAWKWKW